MTDGAHGYTGDKANAAAVAAYLAAEGLRDPAVLAGARGLKFFAHHGLTPDNQAAVIALLPVLRPDPS